MTSRKNEGFNMNVGDMTPEQVVERLRELGIEADSWVSNEDRVKEGDKAKLPTLSRYAEILKQIGSVIEDRVEKDVKEMDSLKYQLMRLRRGGGS